jgi:hypothetical protein
MKTGWLLLVGLLAPLLFGGSVSAAEPPRIKVFAEDVVSNAIAEFRETDDPKSLADAYARLSRFQTNRFNDPTEVGLLILRQILALLQFCHQARDPNYNLDTADHGSIDVGPTLEIIKLEGRPVLSGTDPNALTNATARKLFKERCAQNEWNWKKCRHEQQLEGPVVRGIREARAGLASFPMDSAERKLIIAIISDTITNATLRARFLDGLVAKPDAKNPEK